VKLGRLVCWRNCSSRKRKLDDIGAMGITEGANNARKFRLIQSCNLSASPKN
jgi:hypothetical protein